MQGIICILLGIACFGNSKAYYIVLFDFAQAILEYFGNQNSYLSESLTTKPFPVRHSFTSLMRLLGLVSLLLVKLINVYRISIIIFIQSAK